MPEGDTDEPATEIIQTIFAEYRTDNYATGKSRIKSSTPDRISSTEDGQVPVAGEGMNQKHCDYEVFCRFFPSYCEEHKTACPHGSGCQYDSRSHPYQSERDKVLELLNDLRKYANGEYKEADLSDNEHDLRIHLEYENRIWGIMKELRQKAGEP